MQMFYVCRDDGFARLFADSSSSNEQIVRIMCLTSVAETCGERACADQLLPIFHTGGLRAQQCGFRRGWEHHHHYLRLFTVTFRSPNIHTERPYLLVVIIFLCFISFDKEHANLFWLLLLGFQRALLDHGNYNKKWINYPIHNIECIYSLFWGRSMPFASHWRNKHMASLFNPFKPEFIIVIFIHYKPWIAVAILDL